jgi:pimeloyl-ACP methyl ester carboxylesterase
MFRTRFKDQIVAEFLPPSRPRKTQKLIILCDGMPSIPRKQPLSEFLAGEGFWVIYPRYRGAWESGGEFLEKPPHQDILDILDELPKELEEIAFGRRFRLSADQIFVIGGSFGGAAAVLLSLDPRVKRVIANCPVVDWRILDRSRELRRICLRSIWKRVSPFQCKLDEIAQRHLLQPVAPKVGNRRIKTDDFPRQRRSECAV